MDRQQDVIRRITAHVVAYRFQLENERHSRMSRLTEKLKAASEVVGRQTAKIEARADAILAREPLLEHQTDAAFSPHEALLDEAEQGVDALGRQLALLSNNPPLEHSTPLPASPEVEPAASQPQGSANAPADPQPNGADVLVRAAE
jgi:DNA-directed RNA polymerase subunit L